MALTRAAQRPDTAYTYTDGMDAVWFVSPDGEGRIYYDTLAELQGEHGPLPVVRLSEPPSDF